MDARTEDRLHAGGSETSHGGNRRLDDTCAKATPTRVNDAGDTF